MFAGIRKRLGRLLNPLAGWFGYIPAAKPAECTYRHFGLDEEQIEIALDLEDAAEIARIQRAALLRHQAADRSSMEKGPQD